MMAALREHVCRGNRIYSEGGGTAYLGRWMRIGGKRIQGPESCRSRPSCCPPVPRAGVENPPQRLLAGHQGNGRPGLQEQSLAASPQRRATRMPRLLRLLDRRRRSLLPPPRRGQHDPSSSRGPTRVRRRIRGPASPVAPSPIHSWIGSSLLILRQVAGFAAPYLPLASSRLTYRGPSDSIWDSSTSMSSRMDLLCG